MKKADIALLIINIYILISTTIITIWGIIGGANSGQFGNDMIGLGFLKAFTNLSNILMGICSLLPIINLLAKKTKLTSRQSSIYLMGVNGVVITFLTVLFFLAPVSAISNGINGFINSYKGFLFFFHFLNPILAVVSFFMIRQNKQHSIYTALLSTIPVVLYSFLYMYNVLITKAWNDFYGFTFGGKYHIIPFVLIIMYGVSFIVGFTLTKLKNTQNKENHTLSRQK